MVKILDSILSFEEWQQRLEDPIEREYTRVELGHRLEIPTGFLCYDFINICIILEEYDILNKLLNVLEVPSQGLSVKQRMSLLQLSL